MRIFDIIALSLRNLWRRKLRASLTILGVVIGTSAILLMVSLGIGMDVTFSEQMNQMGTLSVVNVYPAQGSSGLTVDEMSFMADLPDVEMVIPSYSRQVKLVSGQYEANVTAYGLDAEAMKVLEYNISEGDMFVNDSKYLIVVGSEVGKLFDIPDATQNNSRMNQLFGMSGANMMKIIGGGFTPEGEEEDDEPPKVNVLEDIIRISSNNGFNRNSTTNTTSVNPKMVEVSGVLESDNNETANSIYMSIEAFKKFESDLQKMSNMNTTATKQEEEYSSVKIKVTDMNGLEYIVDVLGEMGYRAFSTGSIVDTMKQLSATLQIFLGGIGAISLLVAAIGIANTMIMSIYERIREIGIMKVIGARLSDIRKLFLTESAMIGLAGGIFGIGISYLLSILINRSNVLSNLGGVTGNLRGGGTGRGITSALLGGSGLKSVIPIELALAAALFAIFIGIVAGYFPARKAMKISPLQAIHTE